MSAFGIDIGRNPDLKRLIFSPDDWPNSSRVVMMIFRLRGCVGVIMVVSSANCRTVVEIEGREISSFSKRLNSVCRALLLGWIGEGIEGHPGINLVDDKTMRPLGHWFWGRRLMRSIDFESRLSRVVETL
jgi:hypothetical protein